MSRDREPAKCFCRSHIFVRNKCYQIKHYDSFDRLSSMSSSHSQYARNDEIIDHVIKANESLISIKNRAYEFAPRSVFDSAISSSHLEVLGMRDMSNTLSRLRAAPNRIRSSYFSLDMQLIGNRKCLIRRHFRYPSCKRNIDVFI